MRELSGVPEADRDAAFRSPESIQRKSYDLITAASWYPGTRTRGGALTRQIVPPPVQWRLWCVPRFPESGYWVLVVCPGFRGVGAHQLTDQLGLVEVIHRLREGIDAPIDQDLAWGSCRRLAFGCGGRS
jgi:hypothetical protein